MKGVAVDQLHDDEVRAMLEPDIVDGADVGMMQRRDGFRFALEAREGLGIDARATGKTLTAMMRSRRTAGAIDLTHAARAKRANDL